MGGQLQPEEAEKSFQKARDRLIWCRGLAKQIESNLNSLYYDGHPSKGKTEFPGLGFDLHDEIAAVEELIVALGSDRIIYENNGE